MKKIIFIVLLFVSTISVGQKLSFNYRYYYNSDVEITDRVFNHKHQEFQTVNTIVSNTNNSLIGVSLYVPFSSFDENYSPLHSKRFSLNADVSFLYDHPTNTFYQQYYNFGLHFKPFKKENIHVSTVVDISEIFEGHELSVWTGFDYTVGVSYNMVEEETPHLVNFYAATNFFVYSQYNTLHPYGNNFSATNDIETIIGIIINIKDIFYIKQGIRTYTESNLPSLTFSPYYSDYDTSFILKFSGFELDFTHVCFHPIESTNENPKFGGVLNSFGLTYKL